MDWSYELLPPAEQVLLRRLSVFAGSFDLETVEGVTTDEHSIRAEEVLDLLARLVDKSLVSVRGHGREARYHLLETVRQYAGEELVEAGAEEDARRRHRDYYLAMARRHLGEGDQFNEALWLIRIDLFYDNLRAALDWSKTNNDAEACVVLVHMLATYWTMGGYYVEGRAWLEQALALAAPTATLERIRLMNALGFLVMQQGEMDMSLSLHSEALALARETGEIGEMGVGAFFVGARVLHRGEVERAAQLLEEARSCLGTVGSTEGMAWCEMMLGWVGVAADDRDGAAAHFAAALELGQPSSFNLRAHALGGAALLAAEAGDDEGAEAMANQAVEEARRLDLKTILIMALTRAAEVGLLLGRWDWTEKTLVELLTVLRNAGGRAFLADALDMAGLAQEGRGYPRVGGAAAGGRRACPARDERDARPPARHTARRGVSPPAGCRPPRGRRWLLVGATPPRSPCGSWRLQRQSFRRPAARVRNRVCPRLACSAAMDGDGLSAMATLASNCPTPRASATWPACWANLTARSMSSTWWVQGRPIPVTQGRSSTSRRSRPIGSGCRELQEDIEEAQAWNDPERAARAEAELEAITHELAAGVGLGGRDRKGATAAERARVSVRKAIASSVAQIRERDSDLGLLLATTVKTGTYCRYTPDPRMPVTWSL